MKNSKELAEITEKIVDLADGNGIKALGYATLIQAGIIDSMIKKD